MSRSGAFRQLDGLFDQTFRDRFYTGALEAATLRGRLWGIPDNYGNSLMLIYDRRRVSEAPVDSETWIAQLATFTDEAADSYGLAFFYDEPYWLLPWLGAFGGWPLDAQDQPTLDTPAMHAALRFVRYLRLGQKVVPPQIDYDMAFDYFRQGRAAYLIDGEWSLEGLRQAGVRFGVAPLPAVSATGRVPTPVASGRHWFIAARLSGSRLQAAQAYVTHMTSAQAQERWLAQARRLPSRRQVAEAARQAAADPVIAGALAQLEHTRGLPPALEMRCVWSAMRPGLGAVLAGSTSVEDAARVMQADAVRCIGERYG